MKSASTLQKFFICALLFYSVCPQPLSASPQTGQHPTSPIPSDTGQQNVLVASRYALKSDGTKGLLFGAKFLSFFTITSTSFILETTTTEIARSILKGTAKEIVKDHAKSRLLSSLPGMDTPRIRYISYAFPLDEGQQPKIDDIIVLLETAGDRDLVPLGIPVQLSYIIQSQGYGEPTVALKQAYNIIHYDHNHQYPYMSIPELMSNLRATNQRPANFSLQTYGVVDGYHTTTVREQGQSVQKTFLIMKEYDNYDMLFMQTTDLDFIAIDVSDMDYVPVPGSVMHLWGKPVRLSGMSAIYLRDYSSERSSVSRYISMDGHTLLYGDYDHLGNVEFNRSVFSVKEDPYHWDAVVLDLYHGGYDGLDQDQSGTFTDPRDGNTYRWVRVGNQVWMTENLAYRPITGNYWVTDNIFPNLSRYGYLYDYHTAVYVCPDGWNLPGQNDWVNLFNAVGYKGSDIVTATGLQLFDQVEIIDLESQLAGFRTSDGSFKMAEQSGVWWSITPYHSLALHTFAYEQSQPDVEDMAQNIEDYAFSVRCLKDRDFELTIQVLDERGRPAPNVQVEFENVTKQFCHWALTDQRGMVVFDLVRMPEIISISGLVYEEKYGATILIPEINLYSYTVTIPDYPWSESMVTEQTNNLVDLIFKGYNMFSTADYIKNLLTYMQATGLSKVQLGVPTVFSINLVPKQKQGGQPVFEVKGRLADEIFRMLYNINPMFYGTIQGRDARFNLEESY